MLDTDCNCQTLGLSYFRFYFRRWTKASFLHVIPDMKLEARFVYVLEVGKGDLPPPAERSICGTPFSELREPMKKPWKSDREKRLKFRGNFFVGFFGCYWGCYWCWSREDITKIDIVHSTVLRAAMTDFIFPKADNISRMDFQRSVFFEGFLDATDP